MKQLIFAAGFLALTLTASAQWGSVVTTAAVDVSDDEVEIYSFVARRFQNIRITVKNTGNAALRDVAIYASPSSAAAALDISDDVDTLDAISDTLGAGSHGSWSCSGCAYSEITIACDATTDAACQAYVVGN
ncbi:MAG: hypothetical protein NUV56_00585 [Candidatus Uhrbacteria bacterium]|nr:hypothetical protein [Candidatus Uhrbacteria bacterium]